MFPDSEIHYLTKPAYNSLIPFFSHIKKVYLWETSYKKMSLLITNLKNEQYDYIIDLQGKLNSLLIKLLVPSNKIFTYKKLHLLRKMIVYKLTDKKIDSVAWKYIEALPQNRIDTIENIKFYHPSLTHNPLITASVKEIFESYNVRFDNYLIGIFPGSQHFTKQYPVEKYVNFILSIPEYFKCCFIIFGTWEEKILALKIRSLTGMNIIDMTGLFDFPQLISAISLLNMVISGDTGAMHLAAALQKPQIAIFGSTTTNLGFRPLNDNVIVLEHPLKCRPCTLHGRKTCPQGHLDCLMKIHSSDLLKAFEDLFNELIDYPKNN